MFSIENSQGHEVEQSSWCHRWRISTSAKVTPEHFSLAYTVFELLSLLTVSTTRHYLSVCVSHMASMMSCSCGLHPICWTDSSTSVCPIHAPSPQPSFLVCPGFSLEAHLILALHSGFGSVDQAPSTSTSSLCRRHPNLRLLPSVGNLWSFQSSVSLCWWRLLLDELQPTAPQSFKNPGFLVLLQRRLQSLPAVPVLICGTPVTLGWLYPGLGRLHRGRHLDETAHLGNCSIMLRRSATDSEHTSRSLSAGSDNPRSGTCRQQSHLLQFRVSWHFGPSVGPSAIRSQRGRYTNLLGKQIWFHNTASPRVTLAECPERIEFRLCVLVYRCLEGSAPS